MLMASTSSFTPRFSMQVSPSCSFSSNSNPYCMPEQPPPWMNTRSLRLGLPSPRMRSPTLRAAASVNFSVSVSIISVMPRTLRAGLDGRNLGGFGRSPCGRRRGAIGQWNQFPGNDGARSHFNDAIVDISVDAGLFAEHQALAGIHVAIDRAIHDDIGDFDPALDEAALAHRQRTAIRRRGLHVAIDPAIQVQAPREVQVAIE